MKLTFIQTADAYHYADMLSVTAATVTAYARLNGFGYESFLGVKRGSYPWQATFNRVFILEEMVGRGVGGWVCYMDADAWIHDLAYDLNVLFADAEDAALILAPSGVTDRWWDINAGVFFINLDHPDGVELCRAWKAACLEKWPQIANEPDFPAAGPDDQSVLHEILAAYGERPSSFRLTTRDEVNSPHASFIRQCLRGNGRPLDDRLAFIREAVSYVISGEVMIGVDYYAYAGLVVEGLYQGLLGRDPDAVGGAEYHQLVCKRGIRAGTAMVADIIGRSAEFNAGRRGDTGA